METIRIFLESSTIHGVSYISTTRKIARLLWITVIIAAFTIAGFLIKKSFQSWADSPVKTTVENRPITELTLPKVTVCPPKYTYTNLNYDVMVTENLTLDNDTRKFLRNYAMNLIQHINFQEVLSNISMIYEENRYYNWYHGHSDVILPYWGQGIACTDSWCKEVSLKYYIRTRATSGVISTQYFGEKFNLTKIQKDILNIIKFDHPDEMQNVTDMGIKFYVDNNVGQSMDTIFINNGFPLDNQNNGKNWNEPGSIKDFLFSRQISVSNNDELELELMPGFRLRWNHSGIDGLSVSNYKNMTTVFKR